jgi:hypothetical protein
MFLTCDGNESYHTRDLVEQIGLNFYKVAYSRYNVRSWDSTVGIGTGYGLDD